MSELARFQGCLWGFAWGHNGRVVFDDVSLKKLKITAQYSSTPNVCDHFRYKKPKDKRSLPRNYRTRKDPFKKVWNEVQFKLEIQPDSYAGKTMEWLSEKHLGQCINS